MSAMEPIAARIRLAIAGALGRMGRCVVERAMQDARFALVAALVAEEPSRVDGAIPYATNLSEPCDVLIDFTDAQGTRAWVPVCAERRVAMVIGTTGHDAADEARIREAAKVIALVKAANFSPGIHLVARAVRELAKQLGASFDIEIVETHHRHKVDAPSGTALMLLDELLGARGQSRDSAAFGRLGQTGSRPPGQIGVHAVRLGDVVGRHEVHFSGDGETISVQHEAHSREAFAAGALLAAAWVVGKPPGLYGMSDVVA